jgi:hypothetical protein
VAKKQCEAGGYGVVICRSWCLRKLQMVRAYMQDPRKIPKFIGSL